MKVEKGRLVLVSGSPRRRDMLRALGVNMLQALPPDEVEEILLPGRPVDSAAENARRKLVAWVDTAAGRSELARPGRHLAIGVDTIVVHEGQLMGKPADEAEARRHLQRLSGTSHEVVSAVACVAAAEGPVELATARTRVRFRPLDEASLSWYLAHAAWHDKAGSYGIQEHAGLFVEGIEGCYFNVVGLPLAALGDLLRRFGLDWPDFLRGDGGEVSENVLTRACEEC